MKSFLSLVAVCTVVAIAGCNSSNKSANMGAVGEKDCCAGKTEACCKDKAAKSGTSMGAVGEKKSGCCSGEAKPAGASMGAVGEAKPGCCSGAAKAACPATGK